MASAAQVSVAAKLLRDAKRPVIAIGSGVDRGNAGEAVLALAAVLGCGVITSMAGRSAGPQDHAHHLYGYGAGADTARGEAERSGALQTRDPGCPYRLN